MASKPKPEKYTHATAAAEALATISRETHGISLDQSIAFAHAQATLALTEAQERANYEARTANMIAAAALVVNIDGHSVDMRPDITRIDERLDRSDTP